MVKLNEQLTKLRQQETRILKKIEEVDKRRRIQCNGCGHQHPINSLKAIQTHWYGPPSGHTEGDYWQEGELQFVCPKTGIVNRILFNNDDVPWDQRGDFNNNPEKQFKQKYKPFFGEVDEEYEKPHSNRYVNNFYVDQNRQKFGLVRRRS